MARIEKKKRKEKNWLKNIFLKKDLIKTKHKEQGYWIKTY